MEPNDRNQHPQGGQQEKERETFERSGQHDPKLGEQGHKSGEREHSGGGTQQRPAGGAQQPRDTHARQPGQDERKRNPEPGQKGGSR